MARKQKKFTESRDIAGQTRALLQAQKQSQRESNALALSAQQWLEGDPESKAILAGYPESEWKERCSRTLVITGLTLTGTTSLRSDEPKDDSKVQRQNHENYTALVEGRLHFKIGSKDDGLWEIDGKPAALEPVPLKQVFTEAAIIGGEFKSGESNVIALRLLEGIRSGKIEIPGFRREIDKGIINLTYIEPKFSLNPDSERKR